MKSAYSCLVMSAQLKPLLKCLNSSVQPGQHGMGVYGLDCRWTTHYGTNPRSSKVSYSLSPSPYTTPSLQPLPSIHTETGASEDGKDQGQKLRLRRGRAGSTDTHAGTEQHPTKGPSDSTRVRVPGLEGGEIPCLHIVKILSAHAVTGMKLHTWFPKARF